MKHALIDIIDRWSDVRVLVIGDVMLDTYTWCEVRRISPEASVPIATIRGESHYLGGAANVAHNARALGAHVSLLGVVGNDREGEEVITRLANHEIDYSGVLIDASRPTTLKRRICSESQHLVRIDSEVTNEIDERMQESLKTAVSETIASCDVVVVSDYCKGVCTDSLIRHIKEEAARCNKKMFVDSKNHQLLRYSNVYLVKPNREEAERITGERFADDYTNLASIGAKLSALFHANVLITLAGDGMAFFENGKCVHKPTKAQEVFDVSGAGDTVLATVAVAIAAGATLEDAVELSNYAAGYVVSRRGTVVCDREVLKMFMSNSLA